MNELLKYVFENNNLITHVIFNRNGVISVKRNGDDFYLYFKDADELVEYVKLKNTTLKDYETKVASELKKYPLLKWQNKKTATLVRKLFKDGLSISETVNWVILNN